MAVDMEDHRMATDITQRAQDPRVAADLISLFSELVEAQSEMLRPLNIGEKRNRNEKLAGWRRNGLLGLRNGNVV
jgi:hypothetical protein